MCGRASPGQASGCAERRRRLPDNDPGHCEADGGSAALVFEKEIEKNNRQNPHRLLCELGDGGNTCLLDSVAVAADTAVY